MKPTINTLNWFFTFQLIIAFSSYKVVESGFQIFNSSSEYSALASLAETNFENATVLDSQRRNNRSLGRDENDSRFVKDDYAHFEVKIIEKFNSSHGVNTSSLSSSQLPFPSKVFYKPGDIPARYISYIKPTSLDQFNGAWHTIIGRSDSIENILTALNVAPFKRRILANYEGVTEIKVAGDNSSIYMRNYLPAGNILEGRIFLTGQRFSYEDSVAGKWSTRATYSNNRLVQVRQGANGTMYDVRAVFAQDPEHTERGPCVCSGHLFLSILQQSTRQTAGFLKNEL